MEGDSPPFWVSDGVVLGSIEVDICATHCRDSATHVPTPELMALDGEVNAVSAAAPSAELASACCCLECGALFVTPMPCNGSPANFPLSSPVVGLLHSSIRFCATKNSGAKRDMLQAMVDALPLASAPPVPLPVPMGSRPPKEEGPTLWTNPVR